MEKSYVTLVVCPICGKENGELLMDRRLKPTFERHTVTPTGVCDKCKKKYLSKGVMLIAPETCRLVVLKDEAFKGMFNKPIPPHRIAFTNDEVLDKLQSMVEKGGEKA